MGCGGSCRATTRRNALPRGDREFDALVRAHQGAVRAFLRRLTGEHARADDMAQDVFLRLHRRRDALGGVRNMRAWLYRLAYRRFLDERRKTARREALAPEPSAPIVAARGGAALDVARAMDALPPDRRACALLVLALGHSHAEAAGITGLSLGTVKSHVARAKAALRESLHEYG